MSSAHTECSDGVVEPVELGQVNAAAVVRNSMIPMIPMIPVIRKMSIMIEFRALSLSLGRVLELVARPCARDACLPSESFEIV